jgi:predicted dehydrogenase
MKKLKIVLIGYGNMGHEWRKVISKSNNVQVAGVVDLLEGNRKQAIRDFSLNKNQISDDLKELLLKFHPDFVIDCSPPAAHLLNARLSLEFGSHVLGEKPMAMSLNEALTIIRIAKLSKKIYMINQNYRRNPIIPAVQKALALLGRLHSIDVDYFQGLEFKDTFRYSLSHPLLFDMAIHHLDLLRFLTNSEAVSVFAHEYNPKWSRFKNGASVITNFKMKNGVNFNYRGSWCSVGLNTSYNGYWRFSGELGTLIWNGHHALVIERKTGKGILKRELGVPKKLVLSPYKLFQMELSTNLSIMIQAIKTGAQPDSSCSDNLKTLKMVLGAIQSSEKKRAIVL